MKARHTRSSYISPLATCLIFDDDLLSAAKVENLLIAIPFVRILGSVSDVHGVRKILKTTPHLDILFLGTGANNTFAFKIAQELRDQVECMVFIGDNSESALKAFEAGGDDFLKMPLEDSLLHNKLADLIIRKLPSCGITILGDHLCIPIQIKNPKYKIA